MKLDIITLTRVCAARVLGSFVGAVVTVKLSVTLPLLLVEAAPIGTAELIWTTCRVLCTRTRAYSSLTSVGWFSLQQNVPTSCLISESHTLTTFWGFVRAIGAVDVMIADKVLGDTLSVLAHELGLRVTGIVGVHWKQTELVLLMYMELHCFWVP